VVERLGPEQFANEWSQTSYEQIIVPEVAGCFSETREDRVVMRESTYWHLVERMCWRLGNPRSFDRETTATGTSK
jgi:hypothetical protein